MSKHTPGPWVPRRTEAGRAGTKGWAIDFNEDQEQVVDFVYEDADACLIAAAPDLLVALQMCIAWMGDRRDISPESIDAWVKGRYAIAKATGEHP